MLRRSIKSVFQVTSTCYQYSIQSVLQVTSACCQRSIQSVLQVTVSNVVSRASSKLLQHVINVGIKSVFQVTSTLYQCSIKDVVLGTLLPPPHPTPPHKYKARNPHKTHRPPDTALATTHHKVSSTSKTIASPHPTCELSVNMDAFGECSFISLLSGWHKLTQ